MALYKNKYRIESARLKNWDYSSSGNYFITICTQNRAHFFGEIVDNEMILSQTGKFAERFWQEIPVHFSYVSLDEFVIMPDHIHGIVVINRSHRDVACNVSTNRDACNVSTNRDACNVSTNRVARNISTNIDACNVSTANNENKNLKMTKISPKYGELATIIRSYKSAVTKYARQINPKFSWQSRFYDHVIRNETALYNIRRYIKNNPKMWNKKRNSNN